MNLFGETQQRYFVTVKGEDWAVLIERKDENELFEWMEVVGLPPYPEAGFYTKPPKGKRIIALDEFLEVWDEQEED